MLGGRFVPSMDPLSDGITCLKMVSRSESGLGNQNKTPTSPYVYVWDNDDVENEAGKSIAQFVLTKFLDFTYWIGI